MKLTTEQILDKLSDFGLKVETQTAWHKIAKNKKAVYLSKTKKSVTAIHVSGFELDHPAVMAPPKKNGAVTGHIDTSHELAEEALFLALGRVADKTEGTKFVPMTAKERKAKERAAKKAEQKAARKAAIAAAVAKKAAEEAAAAETEMVEEVVEELPVAADEG